MISQMEWESDMMPLEIRSLVNSSMENRMEFVKSFTQMEIHLRGK